MAFRDDSGMHSETLHSSDEDLEIQFERNQFEE